MFQFKFPDLGEGLFEGEIVKWLVGEGDSVKAEQNVLEVETAKAVVEITSPKAGIVKKILFKVGDVVKTGEVVFLLDTGDGVDESESQDERIILQTDKIPSVLAAEKSSMEILATPAVRKLARELKIDLININGTGPHGRITEDDVRKTLSGKVSGGDVERVKLHGIRKEIAESITKSKFTMPHATVMNDAHVTSLVAFRERIKPLGEKSNVKITFLPLVVKAVIESLKKHPILNSSLDSNTNEIVLKKFYNIGIAVDTPNGVVVPVIKSADKKSIIEISKEMVELSAKARDKRLSLDDIRHGTFTITNVGSVGARMSIPIINYGEAAILAMHTIFEAPVVKDGKIVVEKVLPFSVSFDHRIMDGAEASRFLNDVIVFLREPEWMMDLIE